MPAECIDLFKKHFLAIRDRLLQERSDALNGHRVVDVIFFPEFSHVPMIRIDGSDMSNDQVADLEGRAAEFLVRENEYAGIVNAEVLYLLERSGFAIKKTRASTDRYNAELMDLVNDFFTQVNFSSSGYRIWEVEMHNEDVVIRLTADSAARQGLVFAEGLRIDILPEYHWEGLQALLGFYDDCKKRKKPFLRTLKEFILHQHHNE